MGSSALALDWLSSRANNATLGGKCTDLKPSNMHISGRVQTGYMRVHNPLIGEYTCRTGDAATRLRPQGGSSIRNEAEREAAARTQESAGKGRHSRYSGEKRSGVRRGDDRQTPYGGEPVSPEIRSGTFVGVYEVPGSIHVNERRGETSRRCLRRDRSARSIDPLPLCY